MAMVGLRRALAWVVVVYGLCLQGIAQTNQQPLEAAGNGPSHGAVETTPVAPGPKHKSNRPAYHRSERETSYDVTLVTVSQLEEALRAGLNMRDGDLAFELEGLVLTERMTSERLAAWEQTLHGKRSRLALVALADGSAFLDPPLTDVSGLQRPSLAEQNQMVAKAITLLTRELSTRDRLISERTTTQFQDTWEGWTSEYVWASGQPWRKTDDSRDSVTYEGGEEVPAPDASTRKSKPTGEIGMAAPGTFGSLLAAAIVDASRGEMAWSRWEQGANGPEAVFSYRIPEKASHYAVKYVSIDGRNTRALSRNAAYHGEIAMAAGTGDILRLTVVADLPRNLPLLKSKVMVEYRPTTLDGKPFLCPARSVALSSGQALSDSGKAGGGAGPEITVLNDVVFGPCRLAR
ncbi:MAG TPA: hypothetical protein VFI20_08690 [Terracidiphilus sp.]|nr:hypothetical protein [Terracidiphilus sp.]